MISRHHLATAILALGACAGFLPGTVAAATLAAGEDFGCAIVDQGVMCWGSNEFGQIGNPAFGDVATATPVATLEPGTNAGVTAIATGAHHACAVVKGGVKCWGENTSGQLGVYPLTNRGAPVAPVSQNLGVTAITAGLRHTCAIVSGAVWCWGDNAKNQLGDGTTTSSFVPIVTLPASAIATAIAAGDNHACAIADGGALECWGDNTSGQISPLGTSTAYIATPRVVMFGTDHPASVVAGREHTCVINPDGSYQSAVRCWGNNGYGQLGNGTNVDQFSAFNAPTVIGAGSNASFIAAGGDHSCAVINGLVSCWGGNRKGELGIGSQDDTPYATPIGGLFPMVEVAAGAEQTCARGAGNDMNISCWGRKGHGRLGGGKDERIVQPTAVAIGSSSAKTISSGTHHGCLVLTTGAAKCWGQTDSGQLGNGVANSYNAYSPTAVSGIASGATAIFAGGAHSCSIVSGVGKCWGADYYGQLTDDPNGSSSAVPVDTHILGNPVKMMSTGPDYSCAIVSSGVWCAGRSDHGQAGQVIYSVLQPYQIPALAGVNVTAITSGDNHACAIVSGGVKCWGANDLGQVGVVNDNDDHVTPNQVIPAGSHVTAIAAGTHHTCALLDDGSNQSVKCWGADNHGQLGNGVSFSYFPTPDLIVIPGATAIAAGGDHTCVVISSAMKCWGRGDSGELGLGNFDDHYSPVHPLGLDFAAANSVKAITAGATSTCAIVDDASKTGKALCWGSNEDGAIGAGVSDFIYSPVAVKANDVIFANRFELKP